MKKRKKELGRTYKKTTTRDQKNTNPTKQSRKRRKSNSQTSQLTNTLLMDLIDENKKFEATIARKVSDEGAVKDIAQELPMTYNQTRLVLIVRDPYWVYAYWDLSMEKRKEIENYIAETRGKARCVLRMYDITDAEQRRDRYFDIEVPFDIGQWYVYLGLPNHTFCADLGFIDEKRNFYLIAWSNSVVMPLDAPSAMLDNEWNVTDKDLFEGYHPFKMSRYHSFFQATPQRQ